MHMVINQWRLILVTSACSMAFACGTDDGMPNNMNMNQNQQDAGTVDNCNIEPTFTSLYDNVFNTVTCNVAGCHGAPAGGQLDLASDKDAAYMALMSDSNAFAAPQSKRIVPNSATDSYLWTRVNSMATDVMPPVGRMDENCELKQIEAWINAGAPNN